MAEQRASSPSPHEQHVRLLRERLDRMKLAPQPPHACSYIAGNQARDVVFQTRHLPAGSYHALMDLNFRRSGLLIYRPACVACTQCVAIRVDVRRFCPDRSQRRCWKANRGLSVGLSPSVPTPGKYELYRRYLAARHHGQMESSWQAFCEFLYVSPVQTYELVYRREGRLVGVGIMDVDGEAISTVYCYFDPQERGAIGTFNVLYTIEYARRLGVPFVYLGYWVRDARTMNYKDRFRPRQLLGADGTWSGTPGGLER